MPTFDAASSIVLDGLTYWLLDAEAVIAKDGQHTVKLSQPRDGNRVQSTSVALSILVGHTGSGTHTDVEIQISNDIAFENVTWSSTFTALLDGYHGFVATGLVDQTKYYWRARAAYAGSGLWQSWTGGELVPGPPGPDEPAVPTTATASTFYVGDEPTKALDGNMATGWHVGSGATLPHWFQADFGVDGMAVTSFTLRNRNAFGNEANVSRTPRDFQILGSNDGATFETLTSLTGVEWSTATQEKTFAFNNTQAYRYIRIHVTSLQQGTDPAMAWQEVSFKKVGAPTMVAKPWSFTVDTATGRAFGYINLNHGVPLKSDPDSVHPVHYNAGIFSIMDGDAVNYVQWNTSMLFQPSSLSWHFVHSDVNTQTPTPHIWFLKPRSGRPGQGIRIFCFGVGDLVSTYEGIVEVNYGGQRGWTPVQVLGWQTYPPTENAYTELRKLDVENEYIDMQHTVIEITVPDDAIPPGYPIRIRTNGP